MPRSAPQVPAKPHSLRIVQTMPSSPKSGRNGREGARAPGPNSRSTPRVRVRGGVQGDNDEPEQPEDEPEGAGNNDAGEENDNEDSDENEENTNEEESGDGGNNDEPQTQEEIDEKKKARERARRKARRHPQKNINKMWKNYEPFYLGRVTKILPESVPTMNTPKGKSQQSLHAVTSYEEARARCERDVQRIITECRALNQRYTDMHFDIEEDLKVTRKRDCLDGLVPSDDDDDRFQPQDVKRVTDLFKNPTFYSDGADSDDIMQGAIGDCWLMSSFSVLTCRDDLVRKVCVIQDQEVGVYGFVFFRDGEWHQTIIDDKLYLNRGAYDEGFETVLYTWGKDQESKYNELFQQGSKALYFAKCRDDNETWVPLLEKALAKAHGGYDALSGGQTGEALEDLTGGVTTEIYTTNILNKDRFWSEELTKIGSSFMFDATDAVYRGWQGWQESDLRQKAHSGVVGRHAYAVLDTYEGFGVRLVKVRNPWGQAEWNGPWSDGASEWTAEWLQRVGHKFGDDGIFWMSYEDFLRNYKHINRTRVFDASWYMAQKWATVQVPFSTLDYQPTKFEVNVPDDTATVIVLSQLDYRYFQGLQGKYEFRLSFRVAPAEAEDEYICRSKPNYELDRSTNVELQLKKGKYIVLVKVEAYDRSGWGWRTPDQVIKDNLPWRREKVTTMGRLYDLAHRKGLPEAEDESPDAAVADSATQTTDTSTGTDAAIDTPATGPTDGESKGTEMSPEAMAAVIAAAISSDTDDSSDSDSDSDSDDEEEEEEKIPWNASCVLGLRVYSKLEELSVRVILPPKPKVEKPNVVTLDRDDITKSSQEKAEKDEQQGEDDKQKDQKDKKDKEEEKKKKDKKDKKDKEEEKKKEKKDKDEEKKGKDKKHKEKEKEKEKEKNEEYSGPMSKAKGNQMSVPVRGGKSKPPPPQEEEEEEDYEDVDEDEEEEEEEEESE